MMQGMVIDMEEARLQIVAQVKAFFDGTPHLARCVQLHVRNSCGD
jgi:hypothetical protein